MWHSLAIQDGLRTRTLAQAVENTKGHVQKGCLDENKVGTQPCENLHKHPNRIMQTARHGVEYANAKLATFLHHRNWRIMQRKVGQPDFFLWPHECENPDNMDTTSEISGVPPDHVADPIDVDEDILVEVWDAICQAGAYVRGDVNDLFLKHPNMRVLDGFGKDAWTVKRIRVPGDGFCLYRALQVALHRDATIDELTWEDVHFAVLREFRARPARYRHFFPGADWLQQVQDFEHAGAKGWNTAVGDAVPLAAANAYGTVSVIHRPGRKPMVVLPVAGVLLDAICLHLQGNHYEPLVANEENVPSSPPSLVGEV